MFFSCPAFMKPYLCPLSAQENSLEQRVALEILRLRPDLFATVRIYSSRDDGGATTEKPPLLVASPPLKLLLFAGK